MNPHRVKKLSVSGLQYEAICLTGYGPMDKEIFDWVNDKAGRKPINLDDVTNLSIGLAYSTKKNRTYLVCNSYIVGSLITKKLKAGRWIVYNENFGRLNLMNQEEYDDLRTLAFREKAAKQEK